MSTPFSSRVQVVKDFLDSIGSLDFDFYEVRDSDTVIAEYHSESPRHGNAGVYRNTYITVSGFDGEKIALYKEYLNPMRMTELA